MFGVSIVRGKEKFWGALVSGGFVSAASTLALYFASTQGIVDVPEKATIADAITGLVVAFASAFGAYISTNSTPTNISVPAEAVPVPDLEDVGPVLRPRPRPETQS